MNYQKRIGLSFIFLLLTQALFAQSATHFAEGDFATALKTAKEQNKPVFFFAYAAWCPHCNNMKQKVFTNPSVAGFLNQQYVCYAVDMEQGEGIRLRQTYGVRSYPTLIFLDGDGNTLYRLVGELDTAGMIAQARNALDPQQQLPSLKKIFEADKSNADNCLAYVRALRRGKVDCRDVVNAYFATQTDAQLLSLYNWKIFASGVTDLSSRETGFVLSHLKEFADLASADVVEKKIAFMTYEALSPLTKRGDTAAYFKARSYVANTNLFKVDSVLFAMDLSLNEKLGDWNAYKTITMQSADKYLRGNYTRLKDIAAKYLQHVSDNAALENAVRWTNGALAQREDYNTCLLSANLYEKLNDKRNALAMARRAKEFAQRSGLSSSIEADKILNPEQK